ncbi:MAG: hypothetical protein ABSB61_07450 [Anaerolineales bacterium]
MIPTKWTEHDRVAVPKATVLKRIKFLQEELGAVKKEMRSADRVQSTSYVLPIDGGKVKETTPRYTLEQFLRRMGVLHEWEFVKGMREK